MSRATTICEAIKLGYSVQRVSQIDPGPRLWVWLRAVSVPVELSAPFPTELEAFADLRRHLDSQP
jgi:hypothetical protein